VATSRDASKGVAKSSASPRERPLPEQRCNWGSGTNIATQEAGSRYNGSRILPSAETSLMNGMTSTTSRDLVGSEEVALLIAAVGVALALQGWRGRIPDMDVSPYIDRAHARYTNDTDTDGFPLAEAASGRTAW